MTSVKKSYTFHSLLKYIYNTITCWQFSGQLLKLICDFKIEIPFMKGR